MAAIFNPWMLHVQKMGLELKCPLCLNLLDRPTLLPCDHIFCRTCVPNSSDSGSECPICRSSFVGSELRRAPYMESMVTIYKRMDAVTSSNQCQASSQTDNQGGQKNVGTNSSPNAQPSPASPPSFGENNKDSDDAGSDIGGQHIDRRLKTENIIVDTITKRQKLDFGIQEIHSQATYLDSEKRFISKSDEEHKAVKSSKISQKFRDLGCSDANQGYLCAFCKSSRESEASGPMLHYKNGKPVLGDELAQDDVLHVHQKCVEWAPQIFFKEENPDTINNLEVEIARAAKLKCSSCGLKGAALGCLAKSCPKTFHVPCAVNVLDCRWDCEAFLMLCPAHSSQKFPKEKLKPKKSLGRKQSSVTQVSRDNPQSYNVQGASPSKASEVLSEPAVSQKSYNVWEASPGTASGLVLCGSALSSMEKNLLNKFSKISGATISRSWEPNVTHVIASTDEEGACIRTFKVLMGILNGKWILNIDWIKACMEGMHPVEEEPYEVGLDIYGCRDGPKMGRFRIMDKAPKLFDGLNFYFLGEFVPSYKEDLVNLVVAAGGTILSLLTGDSRISLDGSKRIIVYNLDPSAKPELEDQSLVMSLRQKEAEALGAQTQSFVVAHTWILESIAACKLQGFS